MRIPKNELKYLRSLSQKKIRQQEKRFLLEGWRALREALNAGVRIHLVAVLPRFLDDPDYAKIIEEIRERNIELKELSEAELKSVSETVHAQGVIAIVDIVATGLTERTLRRASLIVAADAITDPGNLGSIVRTCDWFGVDILLLGKGSVELHNEKVVRSTVGSLFNLTVVENVDLSQTLPDLKRVGFSVIAVSGDGDVSYDKVEFEAKGVFLFGSEAHGVSQAVRSLSDTVIKIPKRGRAESLNVGVACGIILAHIRSRNNQ